MPRSSRVYIYIYKSLLGLSTDVVKREDMTGWLPAQYRRFRLALHGLLGRVVPTTVTSEFIPPPFAAVSCSGALHLESLSSSSFNSLAALLLLSYTFSLVNFHTIGYEVLVLPPLGVDSSLSLSLTHLVRIPVSSSLHTLLLGSQLFFYPL